MKEISKNTKLTKNKILISIILLVIFAYIIYAIYLLVKDPTDTFTVEEGTVSQEESAVGYVIRDETVIKGENYKNGMIQIISEGNRVAKGENVFRYYCKNENGLLEKIKDTANKYNQQVLYNLNVGLIEFSLQDYESVLTLFQEICQNNETEKIDINVNVKNGFMIIEFIFKPKKEMEYEVDNRYILKEKIADYESIKYVLKL